LCPHLPICLIKQLATIMGIILFCYLLNFFYFSFPYFGYFHSLSLWVIHIDSLELKVQWKTLSSIQFFLLFNHCATLLVKTRATMVHCVFPISCEDPWSSHYALPQLLTVPVEYIFGVTANFSSSSRFVIIFWGQFLVLLSDYLQLGLHI
jgi:hypothetical protein